MVALLLSVPALLALVYRGGAVHPDASRFAVRLIENLVLPVLLPVTALILATSALGNEVEDGTLLFLTLRPTPRWVIAVAKLSGVGLITIGLIEVSLFLMHVVALQGIVQEQMLGTELLAGLAGALAYCAVFLPLGLIAPRRGIIVGLVYILVWEAAAAGISPILATLSVRRYVNGLLNAGLDARLRQLHPADVSGLTSMLVLVGVVLIATGFTTWWLQRMEI